VVTPAAITGNVGTALTFTVSVAAPNPVSYTLSGAPSGMAINSAGVVSWATPLAGTYAVTVTAKDTVSGLTGQGIYTVTVGPAKAPVVTTTTVGPVITAPAMIGVAGKALSGPITIKDSTAAYFSVSISGVPLGMGFSISGQTITAVWASPVTGSYNLKIVVVDSAGRSAQATVPITITAK
jgi:hypothetical protein